jgi:hypothetical protein
MSCGGERGKLTGVRGTCGIHQHPLGYRLRECYQKLSWIGGRGCDSKGVEFLLFIACVLGSMIEGFACLCVWPSSGEMYSSSHHGNNESFHIVQR